jgi:hypothetical protein
VLRFHRIRGYYVLRLISNKVTFESYGYFLHFFHIILKIEWFIQLCPSFFTFIQKPQAILEVKNHMILELSIKTSQRGKLLQTFDKLGFLSKKEKK